MTPDDQTLLVVEDEPFLRKAVAQSLRFPGFQVTAEQRPTTRTLPPDPLANDPEQLFRAW